MENYQKLKRMFRWRISLVLAFTMFTIGAMAQDSGKVDGVITDGSGAPLPGVSVVVKGSTGGTITNLDGKYSIAVQGKSDILVFSFIGFKTQETVVDGRTTINVTLEEETVGLDEVVVVGYGVQKKATLTGAVGNVTNEELIQRPVANTTGLLQGQVAGLITRQQSGLPGADGTELRIRNFGGSPLILIDGVVGNLAQVDPNDIESISVLKDASASIYGARAGNGVVIVTTKRGKSGASQINYHGNVSFTQPTFRPKTVGARKWAEMMHETGLNPEDYTPNHVSYNPETKCLTNTLDGSDYEGYNWANEMYRNWTPQHQHNLSAQGGSERISYFVSLGYTKQESNFTSGDYDFRRVNIRSNVDAKVNESLSVSVDFAYRNTMLDKANFGVEEMYNSLQTAKPAYPIIHEEDPLRATYSGFLQRSPYHQLHKDFSGWRKNKYNTLQGKVELKYKLPFIKGLTARAAVRYEGSLAWEKKVSKPFDVWEYDPVADADGDDPWIRRGTQNANNMKVFSSLSNELIPSISLDYQKTFGSHTLKAVLVGEARTTNWTTLQGERKDILSFEAPYLRYASEAEQVNSENLSSDGKAIRTQTARTSVIGRINYDYENKYMVEFAMRADASAEYPKEGRWGYFPSVSAGWRISEESFLKDNFSALSNLKLRGSYGILGNDAVSSFDYLTGYVITGGYYVFGSSPAPVIASAGLPNPDITWETMKMSNVGLDGLFWDGLIGFEVDLFYRLRENILAQPTEQVPSTFGASLPRTNINKRDNRGFEIALTHNNKIGEVSYHISPMFSWARGKFVDVQEEVLEITDDMDEETKEFNRLWNARHVKEGQWDDRLWGYVVDGYFMNQEEIDNHPINQDNNDVPNQTIVVGDVYYKDLNGDNIIDWRDQKVIGTGGLIGNQDKSPSLPNTMYSLDMGVKYKGFSLNMLWQGAAQASVTFSNSAASAFSNESIPLDVHFDNRMMIDVDGDGNEFVSNPGQFEFPRFTQNGLTAHSKKSSDLWIKDVAYLRLKSINLSYTLNRNLTKRAGIQNCTFYVSGTNLLTFSNLGMWNKSFDPEVPFATNKKYPPVKLVSFGLRLTL